MRNAFIAVLAVVMVVGLAFTAQALDLSVLDGTGNLVAASRATAVATAPASQLQPGTAQTLKFSATVPSTLRVNLSATDIAYTINSDGTYQTKAIDISTSSSAVGSQIKMTVAGAADLKKDGGTETWATKYALKPTTEQGYPGTTSYSAASSFNTAHILTNSQVSLWNKIVVPVGAAAGRYSDEFTATFSEVL